MEKRKTTSTASDWRDGFIFIGNHLALDFLNTCPVQNDEPLELLTDFNAVLRWFRAAGLLTSLQVADLGLTPARNFALTLREFRERLRSKIIIWENGGKLQRGAIDELNELMAKHPMLTRMKADANAPATELWFEASKPEDLFAPLAHSAATLFAHSDRSRVRKCGQCVLHFYDISKKGTRRWCSMQLCGNRLKVAAYAARNRVRE